MSLKTINRFFTATDHFIDKGASALIIIGGVLVALTVVLQVILRYIFKVPLFGLEEFSRLIAVWVYFLGAIFGTKWDSHVQGDVAGRLFRTGRSRAVIKALAWIISLFVCFLFLYHSATYSLWLYGTGERTTGLWWPRIYSVGSMLFGAFFMTIYSTANVIKYSGAAINGLKPAPGGTP
ncbi:MAG: TRAP transporter small permease subunit [Deltaproteobacteria bacterium]|nr:TRAP transporter small permease subunit [Deltaproteobacteria bacterium]